MRELLSWVWRQVSPELLYLRQVMLIVKFATTQDGVGGWSESGVDPSVFSQALMYHAHQAALASASTGDSLGVVYPHDILQQAYDGVIAEEDVVAGVLA